MLWTTLLLLSNAEAKPLKRMDEAELIAVLQQDEDAGRRSAAADLLGDRRATGAIDALGGVCGAEPDADVCEHALAALERLAAPRGFEHVALVVTDNRVHPGNRRKAITILEKKSPDHLVPTVADALLPYRSQEVGLSVDLLDAMQKKGLRDRADLTVLIAQDAAAPRKVRLKALAVAEAFSHPLLFTAQLSLLEDTDKALRVRAAKGLGRSGLPGSMVAPALEQVARTDTAGDVRAAALASLRRYAHPGLLPLVHDRALNERHMFAWGHALELLLVLADETSLPTLGALLSPTFELIDESRIRVIHTAVRVGDLSLVPVLESLVRHGDTPEAVRTEAQAAIVLLKGQAAERQAAANRFVTGVEVQRWDPAAEEPELPTLGVVMGEDGIAVWVDAP